MKTDRQRFCGDQFYSWPQLASILNWSWKVGKERLRSWAAPLRSVAMTPKCIHKILQIIIQDIIWRHDAWMPIISSVFCRLICFLGVNYSAFKATVKTIFSCTQIFRSVTDWWNTEILMAILSLVTTATWTLKLFQVCFPKAELCAWNASRCLLSSSWHSLSHLCTLTIRAGHAKFCRKGCLRIWRGLIKRKV